MKLENCHFPTEKKILQWDQKRLQTTHQICKPIIVTSGCSFTDHQGEFKECPTRWPGYLVERANADFAIDVSRAGAGNEYISTAVLNQLESMTDAEVKECAVVIMWSGLSRQEELIYRNDYLAWEGYIDRVQYVRKYPKSGKCPGEDECLPFDVMRSEILRSWKNIILTETYLQNRNIRYAFSSYVNVFDPPFIPVLDPTATRLVDNLDRAKINRLRKCRWSNNHKDSLYEFCFRKDLLSDDLFHPSVAGGLHWTDEILLPGLCRLNLVDTIKVQ